MPRALEIPIEVTRLDRAVDSVRRFSGQVRGVGTSAEGAAEKARQSWQKTIESVARSQERYLTPRGPASRLQRAMAQREAAEGGGDAARIFDAEAAIARATIGMQRARRQQAIAGQGTFMSRITGMLASTRMNIGGVSPLVGRTAEALGIPLVGGAGLALAGGALAVSGFIAAMKTATAELNTFGEAMRLGGGGAGDVAGAARYGFRGAAGAAAAESFRQRIATDPMAMMFASRMGIRALPEPFGTVNNTALLKQGADALRRIGNAEERLRAARVLGLESALRYIDVSPRVNAIMDRQVQLEEKMAAGGGAKAANDLSVSLEVMTQSFKDLAAVALPGPIRAVTEGVQDLTEALQGNFEAIGRTLGRVRGLTELFNPATFALGIQDLFPPADSQAKNTAAVEDNTQAHRDATDAMKAFLPPGTYGGGPRTAGAAPAGWSGDYLARQMESGALAKGSI